MKRLRYEAISKSVVVIAVLKDLLRALGLYAISAMAFYVIVIVLSAVLGGGV